MQIRSYSPMGTGNSRTSDSTDLQPVALILTHARHACIIGRVDSSAELSVRIIRQGSTTLKYAVTERAYSA
jgi:hypothetical protein